MTFIELEFVATGINTGAENKKKLITFYIIMIFTCSALMSSASTKVW